MIFSMKERAVNGFLDRAVDEMIDGRWDEAGHLYQAAKRIDSMTAGQFEKEYLKDINDV